MEDFVEAEEGLVVVEVEVAIARATANCLYHLLWSMKFVSKYFILALCMIPQSTFQLRHVWAGVESKAFHFLYWYRW